LITFILEAREELIAMIIACLLADLVIQGKLLILHGMILMGTFLSHLQSLLILSM
jgi:hypothetical protein